MKKLLLVIGIVAALFATSCKKDTSVSPTSGGDTPQGDKNECFYFEGVEDECYVKLEGYGNGAGDPDFSLVYSKDKSNWSPFSSVKLEKGERVYIRAEGTNDRFYNSYYSDMNQAYVYSYKSFVVHGCKVGGNIMYLLDGTGTTNEFDTARNKGAFVALFRPMSSTDLLDASDLVLPATTLAEECYRDMFKGCSKLKKAPFLPATTLADKCYDEMFSGCTSLQSVEVGFVNWWKQGDYQGWLKNVSDTGTFTCPAALDVSTRDEKHVPQGWTIVTK